MNLKLNNSFLITDITPVDKPAYLEHLKEKQIYDQTLNIPYPYTEKDAVKHYMKDGKILDGKLYAKVSESV